MNGLGAIIFIGITVGMMMGNMLGNWDGKREAKKEPVPIVEVMPGDSVSDGDTASIQ